MVGGEIEKGSVQLCMAHFFRGRASASSRSVVYVYCRYVELCEHNVHTGSISAACRQNCRSLWSAEVGLGQTEAGLDLGLSASIAKHITVFWCASGSSLNSSSKANEKKVEK